jgi:methionine salvage enolase-phosphatase E1
VKTEDQLYAELAAATGLDAQKWVEISQMPLELQATVLENYKAMAWAEPGSPTLANVLSILELIGTAAGVVSGVGGAVGIVRALAGK